MRSLDRRLSALLDRAMLALEDAAPDRVAGWRRVLAELERAAGL